MKKKKNYRVEVEFLTKMNLVFMLSFFLSNQKIFEKQVDNTLYLYSKIFRFEKF